MSAMILYIITNAVLFSFLMTSEQIPQAMTALDHQVSGIDLDRIPAVREHAAAASPAT